MSMTCRRPLTPWRWRHTLTASPCRGNNVWQAFSGAKFCCRDYPETSRDVCRPVRIMPLSAATRPTYVCVISWSNIRFWLSSPEKCSEKYSDIRHLWTCIERPSKAAKTMDGWYYLGSIRWHWQSAARLKLNLSRFFYVCLVWLSTCRRNHGDGGGIKWCFCLTSVCREHRA